MSFLRDFVQDLRFSARTLVKQPGFLALATITLGLGISANSVIFSLFYQVVLRSLPVPDPERLAILHVNEFSMPGRASSDSYETVFSYPMFRALRDGNHVFEGLAARTSASMQMEAGGAAEQISGEVVSGNFFDVLRVRPRLGRLLLSSDDQPGAANPVVVLSSDFWKKRWGQDPSVLNRVVSLNRRPFTVVGVAAEGFRGVMSGSSPDVYVPLATLGTIDPGWVEYNKPNMSRFTIFGRLGPQVSRQRAAVALEPVFAAAMRDQMTQLKITNTRNRQRLESKRIELVPAAHGLNELERRWREPLLVLAAMVAMLLLIGCANLANLLLARGVNRSRETAVRLALGAGRGQIISNLLAESTLLAAGGAVLGLAMTPLLTAGVLRLLPQDVASGWLSGTVSVPVLLFCTSLMAMTAVISGIAPAWQSTHTNEAILLSDRSASSGGRLTPRVRQALVVGQLALSLLLLWTAGLFASSLIELMRHDPGFRTDNLLTFSVDAGKAGYTAERGVALYRTIASSLAARPGVVSVAVADTAPFSNSETSSNVTVEGYTAGEGENMNSDENSVSPGFFRTLGTPLIAGREFTERDRPGASKIAIVNQTFAKRFVRRGSAVGKHMQRGAGGKLDLEIVGVVADMNNLGMRDEIKPTYFEPYDQSKVGATQFSATFLVRLHSATEPFMAATRTTVAQLDHSLPVFNVATMQSRIDDSLYTDRLLAALSAAFGLVALTLTAVGLYGVIAYVVSRRTAEIGIRMALGATGRNVMELVLREVGLLTFLGVAAGIIGAVAATRAVRSQLFGVPGFDARLMTLVVLILAGVAFLAGLIPALRAARIQPLAALRHE